MRITVSGLFLKKIVIKVKKIGDSWESCRRSVLNERKNVHKAKNEWLGNVYSVLKLTHSLVQLMCPLYETVNDHKFIQQYKMMDASLHFNWIY